MQRPNAGWSLCCNRVGFGRHRTDACAIYSLSMEAPKSTTRYDDSPKPDDTLVLRDALPELPDGSDFVPVVKRRAPVGFLDFCASYLPKLRQRPDYRQRRLDGVCEAEFDLDHPERVPATYPADVLDELLKGL